MVQNSSSSNTDRFGIAVDHSREKATSQILFNSNLLFSCKTAWDGMYLEYHHAPPHETPEHYPLQHVIAIQTEGTVRARRLNGQFRREHTRAGDVCIVPAHTRHWIYSSGEQGLILLSLDPAFLAQVAYDTINCDRIELTPQFAHPEPLLYQLGLSLKTVVQADAVESRFYAQSLGVALTAHLLQYYTTQKYLLPSGNSVPALQLQQAIDYIHAHLTEGLSLEAIAAVAGMSQYHFTRVFKQAIGITPWQYVVQQRIEAAKRLLAKHELSITQVSQQLGFSTQAQFSSFFRKHTGMTSTEYRQAL